MQELKIPTRQAVTLSDAAQAHFAATAKNKIVKFGVEGGSCAGLKYSWKVLDDKSELYPDDEVTNYKEFTFAVDGASLLFIIGCTVDFVNDLTGNRIEIVNPNAKASCGCGESFNAG